MRPGVNYIYDNLGENVQTQSICSFGFFMPSPPPVDQSAKIYYFNSNIFKI